MTGPPRVVVDTNVLLAATDESRTAHDAATSFLETDQRALSVTPQIIREYLVVATRPASVNGFGLSAEDAVANVEELLQDLLLLPEDAESSRGLLDVVREGPVVGKQVHDANVVAVARRHGATAIATDNVKDFARFTGLIEVEGLSGDPSA